MTVVATAVGLTVGIVQIILTGCISQAVIEAKKSYTKPALFLLVKLAVYGGAIAALLLIKNCPIMWAGIGYGAGMVIGCAVFLLIKRRKSASLLSDEEGSDKE